MGGKHCLPEHLRDEPHRDWLWPFSYIPRAWNAFCGLGPVWKGQQQPIPSPGRSTHHWRDEDGRRRPYYARTWQLKNFWNGRYLHFRIGFRWDDVDFYYNLVLFNLSWEDR